MEGKNYRTAGRNTNHLFHTTCDFTVAPVLARVSVLYNWKSYRIRNKYGKCLSQLGLP